MKMKEDFTLEDYRGMYQLEKKFYEVDHITPYEEAYRWHLNHPGHCRALESDGQIVAFVDMFPITDLVYEQLLQGEFNDRDLTEEGLLDLEKAEPCTAQMFLCCMVVDQEYRGTGALKQLLLAHIDQYLHYERRGFRFEWIITDNVTEEGERFSRRLGFEKVADSKFASVIYRIPYSEFVQAVTSTLASST